jgi:hypothetical protein
MSFDGEARSKCRDGDVASNSPDTQLRGLVLPNADDARPVRRKIFRLGSDSTVWPREQKVLGNQPIERGNVRFELRRANLRFQADDFGITRPDQDG